MGPAAAESQGSLSEEVLLHFFGPDDGFLGVETDDFDVPFLVGYPLESSR